MKLAAALLLISGPALSVTFQGRGSRGSAAGRPAGAAAAAVLCDYFEGNPGATLSTLKGVLPSVTRPKAGAAVDPVTTAVRAEIARLLLKPASEFDAQKQIVIARFLMAHVAEKDRALLDFQAQALWTRMTPVEQKALGEKLSGIEREVATVEKAERLAAALTGPRRDLSAEAGGGGPAAAPAQLKARPMGPFREIFTSQSPVERLQGGKLLYISEGDPLFTRFYIPAHRGSQGPGTVHAAWLKAQVSAKEYADQKRRSAAATEQLDKAYRRKLKALDDEVAGELLSDGIDPAIGARYGGSWVPTTVTGLAGGITLRRGPAYWKAEGPIPAFVAEKVKAANDSTIAPNVIRGETVSYIISSHEGLRRFAAFAAEDPGRPIARPPAARDAETFGSAVIAQAMLIVLQVGAVGGLIALIIKLVSLMPSMLR